ncbi:MAG: hypothetical protein WC169_00755 [Dehalococcoidia bacterium]|jgi:hypothetical protein
MAGLVAAFGFAFDFTGYSLLSVQPNNWGQIGFIAVIVFIVITFIREIDLAFQQRPQIKIKSPTRNGRATLEIYNSGGTGTLKGNFRTLMRYENQFQPSEPYRMCWEGGEEKVVLNKGDTGVINIAAQRFYSESSTRLILFNVSSNLEFSDWPSVVHLQVTITADPPLKKEKKDMVYKLSQDHATKEIVLVLEKKLNFALETN